MTFYQETSIHDTPVGRLPEDWKLISLQDVSLDFIGGGTPSTSNPSFWNGDIAWMTSAHINRKEVVAGQKYITKSGLENSATNIVPKDNVLVATRVGIGKAAVNEIDIAISQDLTGIVVDRAKVLPDFLYWFLTFSQRKLKSLAQGSTIKGILREDLGRLLVPDLSLSEQRGITEVLGVVDSAIELVDRVVLKTERLKKGLMQQLLVRGIGHKEFKDSEIGKIPKEWQVVKIKDVAEMNKESRDPSKESPNQSFLYVDIESVEGETGKIRSPKTVLGNDAPSRARRVIHEKDIIMSTVRPYLKAFAIIPKEYEGQICSTGFAVLSSTEKILPYFLLSILFSDLTINQCNRMMMGGQYPAINESQVSRIRIPLPSLSEQKRIAEIFLTLDGKLELERQERERLERIKLGLMDLLFTGKVRVKVD